MVVAAQVTAEKLGVSFATDVDHGIDVRAAAGAHRAYMCQDQDKGRPMDIDALVTAAQGMGVLTGMPVPIIDIAVALA